MKMTLCIRRNKNGLPAKNPIIVAVDFNYDRSGEAQCFEIPSGRIFRLKRAKIDVAGADGMMISGLEDFYGDGLRLTYQEWWLCPS